MYIKFWAVYSYMPFGGMLKISIHIATYVDYMLYVRTQVIASKKAATNPQEDFIQYQTTSDGAARTQWDSSDVQYALPYITTANNTPGVSIYILAKTL